ncbi:Bacterial DNA-binding protein [Gemmata obscuriglobus]|uniref:DNA-binding protein n=1 Tax=Gemmata obscuriglobus TaxID=114 RepID=A0A2Z3HE16_9BACT|nr:HU family DNA-binding protein [Gemmata obscuriglobus]AWM41205.1 DNA-binding protein [Gemmata obscuriglobus]QEG25453.1 Bacterial DNA-binding protein [Gemmata obscuriglobus]VTR98624.1 dna-binding protein : DNA-binding protein BpH2 OS=Coxiella burnetii 'MSU Goat Q177' GN=bph2_1 PE=4 SV=1: Bac_DNA_binding [Gemmata obscuriglobus UQM 2246]
MAKAAKSAAKSAAAKPAAKAAKKAVVKKALTKSQLVAQLSEKTELSKKQVEGVLDAIVDAVKAQLGPNGPGKFVFPGLARMSLSQVAERKGGETKINPLNKQPYVTQPRPAYNKVNIRPVKSIKTELA